MRWVVFTSNILSLSLSRSHIHIYSSISNIKICNNFNITYVFNQMCVKLNATMRKNDDFQLRRTQKSSAYKPLCLGSN